MEFSEGVFDKPVDQASWPPNDEVSKESEITYIDVFSKVEDRFISTRQRYIENSKLIVGTDLYLEDFFFVASIDKGIRLLDGIKLSLENRNITCSAVLYRAQIDLCMRTYAAFIAEDPQGLIEGYLEGKPICSFTDKNGNKMVDAYLRKQLDLRCPGLSASYSLASDFVHFSREALSLIARTDEQNIVTMGIGLDHNDDLDESLFDLGSAALSAADLHISLIRSVVESRIRE